MVKKTSSQPAAEPDYSQLDSKSISFLNDALSYALTVLWSKRVVTRILAAIHAEPHRKDELLRGLGESIDEALRRDFGESMAADPLADPEPSVDEMLASLPASPTKMLKDSVGTTWRHHRRNVYQVLERIVRKAQQLELDTAPVDRMQAILCVNTREPVPAEFWPLLTDLRALVIRIRRGEVATAGDVEAVAGGPSSEMSVAEKAIALLMRDGRQPKSARKYADEVGVAHTTLTRNPQWCAAYAIAEASAEKGLDEMPSGGKDQDGKLEAWVDELCENCREEPVAASVVVDGEAVQLCKECAADRA